MMALMDCFGVDFASMDGFGVNVDFLNCTIGILMSHRPSVSFLFPVRTRLLCLCTYACFLSKVTMQSSSHSCPVEINVVFFKLGTMYPVCASFERWRCKVMYPA